MKIQTIPPMLAMVETEYKMIIAPDRMSGTVAEVAVVNGQLQTAVLVDKVEAVQVKVV